MTSTALPTTVAFGDQSLAIIDHAGQPWLSAADLARALEYSDSGKVSRVYRTHATEFTDAMSATITVRPAVRPESGRTGVPTETRIFSPRGCHLIAMFAGTPRAAAFRRWVLDVLEGLAMPKAAPPALTAASLRSAILAEGSAAVALPAVVQAALDAKAATFAVEMLELSRQHLARRIAHSATSGYPKPTLDTAAALEAIDDTTLGDVLLPQATAQLRMVRMLARGFANVAADTLADIDARYGARGPALATQQGDK